MTFYEEMKKLAEMESQKDLVIVEFITKFQYLAYQNELCFLCGGRKIYSDDFPESWKPEHLPDCLFSRAEKLVMKG